MVHHITVFSINHSYRDFFLVAELRFSKETAVAKLC